MLEGWKFGMLEGWKVGILAAWLVGRLAGCRPPRPPLLASSLTAKLSSRDLGARTGSVAARELYTVHCTVYSVHCKLYTVQFTVYRQAAGQNTDIICDLWPWPGSAKESRPVQFSAVQCGAVQCTGVPCSAVQCSAVKCSAVTCRAVQCSAVQCSTVQCSVYLLQAWKRYN